MSISYLNLSTKLFKKEKNLEVHKNPHSLLPVLLICRRVLVWERGKNPSLHSLADQVRNLPSFYNPCLCQPGSKGHSLPFALKAVQINQDTQGILGRLGEQKD